MNSSARKGGADTSTTNTRKPPKWRQQQIAHKENQRQERRQQGHRNIVPGDRADRFSSENDSQDPDGIETRRKKGSTAPRTFSQPSVMTAGDKGVFLTTDIGKEKKGCLELGVLVEEYLDSRGLLEAPSNTSKSLQTRGDTTDDADSGSDMDIETAIASELSTFRSSPITNNDTRAQITQHKPFQLITLDVPCLSFLRFHPLFHAYASIDPVTLVHSICNDAMSTGTMKSRYIRRLSPISWLGKTLADGLARCCDEVLPKHFAIPPEEGKPDDTTAFHVEIQEEQMTTTTATITGASSKQVNSEGESSRSEQEHEPTTFAIRPSIRNNTHILRDPLIHTIASRIDSLGHKLHKVDLKNYRKGVLVEVYRGWIGMSVVQNENRNETTTIKANDDGHVQKQGRDQDQDQERKRKQDLEFEHGYEKLKRFNLAEIYGEAMKNNATAGGRGRGREE